MGVSDQGEFLRSRGAAGARQTRRTPASMWTQTQSSVGQEPAKCSDHQPVDEGATLKG